MMFRLRSAAVLLPVLLGSACAHPLAGSPALAPRPLSPPGESVEIVTAAEPLARLPEQQSARALPPQTEEPSEREEPGEQGFDEVFTEEEVEQESGLPAGPLPLYGAIVMQKVANYEAWRAGFVAQGIMRGVDDSKLVAVWLAVTDVALAKAFFADKTLRARAKSAGVVGTPQVQLSSNVSAKMEPGRQGLSAAIVSLRVKELPAFKAAFDAEAESRRAAGVIGYALSQDVNDEHLVYLYIQSEAPEALKAYLAARETKQVWRDAGVVSVSRATVVRESELTLCR